MTTHKGKVVWKARYRTWGSTVLEEWDAQYERSDDGLGKRSQNLRFQGQYLDAETGLHYNTFRYYDPDIGRFATQDPIGLEGGQNLYQYAANTSAWIDPWGWACGTGKPTKYHKRTVSQVAKLRAAFDKSGGARGRFLKGLARNPNAEAQYGSAALAKMKKGQVPDDMVVHHKKPLFRGGTNTSSNLDLIDKKIPHGLQQGFALVPRRPESVRSQLN